MPIHFQCNSRKTTCCNVYIYHMAFRFNFPDPDPDPEVTDSAKTKHANDSKRGLTKETSEELHHKQGNVPCEEIYYRKESADSTAELPTTTYKISDDVSVTCYVSDVVADTYSTSNPDSSLAKLVSSNIDVVPDEYEGGLTVWESSIDLSQFLICNKKEIKNKTILELGCGAGIPGICAIKCGAKQVHFQDFNSEVLKTYTIPNVMKLNSESDCECRFFGGDWKDLSITLSHMIKDKSLEKYDCILTAETIYNPDNYYKLHSVFESLLSQDGVIYLAAKSHYFGATSRLGGGTNMFIDYLEKQGIFTGKVVKVIDIAIPREILKIEWKRENT